MTHPREEYGSYEEYVADFDPSPQEAGEGYSAPMTREEWDEQ